MLYQLCKNCNPYFFREFIRELAIEIKNRPKKSKSTATLASPQSPILSRPSPQSVPTNVTNNGGVTDLRASLPRADDGVAVWKINNSAFMCLHIVELTNVSLISRFLWITFLLGIIDNLFRFMEILGIFWDSQAYQEYIFQILENISLKCVWNCRRFISKWVRIEFYTTAYVQKQNITTYKQVWKRFRKFSFIILQAEIAEIPDCRRA